ncbi:amidohydrolase, partial [Streptomyces sp. NPDC000405]
GSTLPAPLDYENARASVHRLHEASVTILAGTDANADPTAPFSPPHGEALHEELRLLVDASLTPVEALRAATVAPAEAFNEQLLLQQAGVATTG